jgi:hypothetical protein
LLNFSLGFIGAWTGLQSCKPHFSIILRAYAL